MVEPITTKYVDVQDEIPDPGVLLEATRDGVAVVLLNRPQVGNGIGNREVAALAEAFSALQGAEGVRLVVLRGAGATFSIGGDVEWMRHTLEQPAEDSREHALDLGQMLAALRSVPALTVALVDGTANGVGAALVAACDMAVATQAASFAFPAVRLGLSPGPLAPVVVEAVGPRAARRLFVSGERIDAAEALRLGLVDAVVQDAAGLDAAFERLADETAACSPSAQDSAKRLVERAASEPLERPLIEDSARRFAAQAVSADGRERLAAFLDKRATDPTV